MMSHAQIPNLTDQKIVDSLFILLSKAEGTAKVDVLNQLALNLAPRSYDSSYQYASEALNLSEKLEYQKGKGIAIFNIGNSYYFTADYKNTMLNYLKALRILENFEPHKELGDLLIMLGALNQYARNTKKVQDYYLQAASNFIAVGDSATLIIVYSLLSVWYFLDYATLWQIDSLIVHNESNTMMDSAIKYCKTSLDICLHNLGEYKWKSKEAWIANLYNLMATYYWEKRYTSDSSKILALNYQLKALEYAHEIKNPKHRFFIEGLICSDLGYALYFHLKNKDRGLEYAKLGIESFKKTERYDQYGFVLSTLGEIEMDKGNFEGAKDYLFLGLNYCDTFLVKINKYITPDPTFRLFYSTNTHRARAILFIDLINLFELTGDYKSALSFQRKLEKEIRNQTLDDLNRQMTGMQVNFEDELQNQQIAFASKEKELAQLKLSRGRVWFAILGSTGIIVFLLILLYFQRKKYSTEQNALLLKQRLLRSQMNPHFIFNSLSGIQNFIVTEKPMKATTYLSKFSNLVRNILNSSIREYITLEEEISTIENYLELQKIRYAGKFDFSIKTDNAIDPETTLIPPMLAQPFIENAIEHGIVHSDKTGQIDVEFRLENDVILFEVRDNGVGREKAKELEAHLEKDHQSMSTSITLERLAMLNKKRKHKIIFDITDLKDSAGKPTGTFVRFGIPLG
jgi:hypothetical protein